MLTGCWKDITRIETKLYITFSRFVIIKVVIALNIVPIMHSVPNSTFGWKRLRPHRRYCRQSRRSPKLVIVSCRLIVTRQYSIVIALVYCRHYTVCRCNSFTLTVIARLNCCHLSISTTLYHQSVCPRCSCILFVSIKCRKDSADLHTRFTPEHILNFSVCM